MMEKLTTTTEMALWEKVTLLLLKRGFAPQYAATTADEILRLRKERLSEELESLGEGYWP